ncbi:cell division protein ZapE [Thalassotalea piscium]
MTNKSPLSQYQALVSSNQISFDPSQQQAVELLQQLYLQLQALDTTNKHKAEAIKGIYLWGKVGRGKTFLMDLFVNSLPSSLCKRQHFHHFMQDVHNQLKALSGKSEPLKHIAQQFSQQYRVLCFDEFFVSDIGDAMLLGNLLKFMFELNITMVSTSNCEPKELYRNGLQRERFLPAIAAIEHYTQPLHLSGERDHRHRTLTYVQNYFELPDGEAEQHALHQGLLSQFGLIPSLADENKQVKSQIKVHNATNRLNNTITILGREISYIAMHTENNNKTICFEFSDLCEGPRSHFDYVEIAKQFKNILLFHVPPMSGQAYERIKARGTEDNGSNINVSAGETGEREVILAPMDDAARRFIALVDECYDCHLNLVITAYVPQAQLYNSGTLMFEFERTKSRLVEMASKEYLDKG